jgi:hypothetical protein
MGRLVLFLVTLVGLFAGVTYFLVVCAANL